MTRVVLATALALAVAVVAWHPTAPGAAAVAAVCLLGWVLRRDDTQTAANTSRVVALAARVDETLADVRRIRGEHEAAQAAAAKLREDFAILKLQVPNAAMQRSGR